MITREGILHQQVCDYLKLRYPSVVFVSDFAAGIKLPIWLASRQKRLKSSRAYPDLFIAEPRNGKHGLYLELKAANIYLKDGSISKERHINEQNEMLALLRKKGYAAEFAVGFEAARATIDGYLKPPAFSAQ